MAEAGTPESTMLALMGHMSRAMLERYSHIGLAVKRDAVEALNLTQKTLPSNEIPKESPQSRAFRQNSIAVSDCFEW
jgi:hypothetical protein